MSEIYFIETDPKVIIDELIADFEAATDIKLYPADPRRLFLQQFGYVLVALKNDINTTGRSNLLRYAYGETLDALGEFYGVTRLSAGKASALIKFTLSVLQPSAITIPSGTRVTPDGKLFFAIASALTIPSGNAYGIVNAVAVESGSLYNEFAIGQINKLVDGNIYVATVTNTTESAGGTDVESDDDFRERIRLSMFGYSVAGPSESYAYWARTASVDVGDVSVYSDDPGVVKIAIVKQGGEIPDDEDPLLDSVLTICSDKTRRPLTDSVEVVPATGVDIAISVAYYINEANLSEITSIQTAVNSAVAEYAAWQTEKLGRNINPDELKKRMLNAGAFKVDVTTPVYAVVEDNEIASITATTVTYSGTIEG